MYIQQKILQRLAKTKFSFQLLISIIICHATH